MGIKDTPIIAHKDEQRAAFEAALGRGRTYTERDFEMFRLGLDRQSQGRGEPVKVPTIPPEKYDPWYEEGSTDVLDHAIRQGYADGWNDCIKAMKETK